MLLERKEDRRHAAVDLLEAALVELDALHQSIPAAHLCLALDLMRQGLNTAPAETPRRSEGSVAVEERLPFAP